MNHINDMSSRRERVDRRPRPTRASFAWKVEAYRIQAPERRSGYESTTVQGHMNITGTSSSAPTGMIAVNGIGQIAISCPKD